MPENICEQKKFEKVYFEHAEYLRNFLYYKCGNLQMAEDLTHDAFSKMWENCAKVIIEKAKSFVFTIGNNLLLNQFKRKKVVLKFNQSDIKKKDLEDPQYLMEHEEFKLKLERMISKLPVKQREVFLMNRIDKMKYREIAETLGISVKAVEKRMHNALKVLKTILDER